MLVAPRACRTLVWLLLSFVAACAGAAERMLLERKSPYQTIYVSEDERGVRYLRFTAFGAIQTAVKLGDPDHMELAYTRAIPAAFLYVEKPRRVLVVGLGGGTIPSFIRKRFPETEVDVVDIDPVVVEIAKSHFGFREDEKMRAYVEDGRKFIERATNRYDIIFLDGFGTDTVPAHLTTKEFHEAVRRALTERGVAVGNVWSRGVNRLYDSMVKTYRTVYDDVAVLDIQGSGNKLLFACPYKTAFGPFDLAIRADTVTRRLSLRTGLRPIIEHGHRAPGEDGATGTLLTDSAVTPSVPPTPAPTPVAPMQLQPAPAH